MPTITTTDRNALRQKLHALIEEAINSDVELNVFKPQTIGDTTTLVLTWRPAMPAMVETFGLSTVNILKAEEAYDDPPEPYEDALAHAIPDDLPDPELEEALPRTAVAHIKVPEVIPEPQPTPPKRGPGRPPKERKA